MGRWMRRKRDCVSNQLPEGVILVGLNPPGATVAFALFGSDPDGTIVSYSWDFGDGSPASAQQSPTHDYAVYGTYQVSVQMTDNDGGVGVATATVVLE